MCQLEAPLRIGQATVAITHRFPELGTWKIDLHREPHLHLVAPDSRDPGPGDPAALAIDNATRNQRAAHQSEGAKIDVDRGGPFCRAVEHEEAAGHDADRDVAGVAGWDQAEVAFGIGGDFDPLLLFVAHLFDHRHRIEVAGIEVGGIDGCAESARAAETTRAASATAARSIESWRADHDRRGERPAGVVEHLAGDREAGCTPGTLSRCDRGAVGLARCGRGRVGCGSLERRSGQGLGGWVAVQVDSRGRIRMAREVPDRDGGKNDNATENAEE